MIIAMALGYTINYIFLRKYLLIVFSAVSIASPFILLLFKSGELYNWLVAVCILNSILLVVLLWRQRLKFPDRPLFNVDRLKKKIPFKNKKCVMS